MEPQKEKPWVLHDLMVAVIQDTDFHTEPRRSMKDESNIGAVIKRALTKSNQEDFADPSSPKAREKLIDVRVESTL